ncbi:MAG: GDP-mannose 4,6-dehydratase [Chloroflexi bacterium]|nr:GDP-mannose 4,6-dehydratase [Chloroflexota bacterium]
MNCPALPKLGDIFLKAIITGATGFVGRYLADYFLSVGSYELYGTTYNEPTPTEATLRKFADLQNLDVRDKATVQHLIESITPDVIIHLAAQTHVPTSYSDPWATHETNIRGTLNILEAVRLANFMHTRILIISSAHVYGAVKPDALPIRETQPFNPGDPYSVSKVAQDALGLQYFNTYGLNVVRVRPFNHTGPGQTTQFVIPNFAMQIAEIEAGLKPPQLNVGNLEAERDFCDVRDVVRAYHLLTTQGQPGAVYNICSGKPYRLKNLVEQMIALSGKNIEIKIDPSRFRPLDAPIVYGDFSALQHDTGWQPQISIEQTLADVLNDCRTRVQA